MLALAQLSNLPAALKRRNSKVGKPSSPAQLSLTLPGHIRRFSSSETLSNHPTNNASPVALVARRSSFSRKMRKASSSNSSTDITSECMQLDMLFAKIKRKLAEFREEDIDIVDRVDDLVTSVGDLCDDYRIESVTTPLSDSLVQLVQEYPADQSPPTLVRDAFHLEVPVGVVYRKKNDSSSEEEDEEFQQFCNDHGHYVHISATRTMPNYRWSASSSGYGPPPSCSGSKRWSASSATLSNSVCKTLQQPLCVLDPPDNWARFNLDRRSPRPLSYQEIAYEEEDIRNSPGPFIDFDSIAGWEDLSCP